MANKRKWDIINEMDDDLFNLSEDDEEEEVVTPKFINLVGVRSNMSGTALIVQQNTNFNDITGEVDAILQIDELNATIHSIREDLEVAQEASKAIQSEVLNMYHLLGEMTILMRQVINTIAVSSNIQKGSNINSGNNVIPMTPTTQQDILLNAQFDLGMVSELVTVTSITHSVVPVPTPTNPIIDQFLLNKLPKFTVVDVFVNWYNERIYSINLNDYTSTYTSKQICNIKSRLNKFARMICYMKIFLPDNNTIIMEKPSGENFEALKDWALQITSLSLEAEQNIVKLRKDEFYSSGKTIHKNKPTNSWRGCHDYLAKLSLTKFPRTNCRHIKDFATRRSLKYEDITNKLHFTNKL